MRLRNACAAASFVALTLSGGARTPSAAASEPHPAVCRVLVEERAGQAAGSGTLIDARERYGLVITNWHVVRDAAGKIEAVFPDGHRSEARALKLDETWDLAALVIWRPAAEPVRLAAEAPRPGEPLTICGYGGGDYRAAVGRCQDYYSPEVGLPTELVELSVAARQGDSGGPILNARGELAGVLFGSTQDTTLGSFGPRVERFLASLAPDIGQSTARIAAGDRAAPAQRPEPSERSRPKNSAVDPFLVAERAGAEPHTARRPSHAKRTATGYSHGASLADRAAGPRLAATRSTPPEDWGPSPNLPTESQPTAQASPEATRVGAVDWASDGKTLLAIAGAAAIVVAATRA
ncbi:MAG: serine protease [Planctomycetota bacterium]